MWHASDEPIDRLLKGRAREAGLRAIRALAFLDEGHRVVVLAPLLLTERQDRVQVRHGVEHRILDNGPVNLCPFAYLPADALLALAPQEA
jgi:hypothetical protein